MNEKPKCTPRQIVLLRHGESVWNMENRFTGWTDIDLSEHNRHDGLPCDWTFNTPSATGGAPCGRVHGIAVQRKNV